MDILTKPLAAVSLVVGIMILLEELNIFEINFFISKIIIGVILLVAIQTINIFLLRQHNGHIGIMNIIMLIIFLIPVIAYFFLGDNSPVAKGSLPLIIGVMILLESLYMLH